MDATYIIFKKQPTAGDLIWVETIVGLGNAKKRLVDYKSSSTDEFFIFDVGQARILDALAKTKSA